MRQLGYYFFKYWVSIGLFFYYRSIKVVGVEHIPRDTPVLFLSNHQNALMDILLIATHCTRKPWYLTRADVFRSLIFRPLFEFLQMLPVYRMRDGKANVSKNTVIFERCGALLNKREAILLFPEANHSLMRRVRPLSKGFTRIIDAALQTDPELNLQLLPIGQNYQASEQAGDSAALYFGKPIPVQDFAHGIEFAGESKKRVFEQLTQLTTHIADDNYEDILAQLKHSDTDFTQPDKVNAMVALSQYDSAQDKIKNSTPIARFLFRLNNAPFIFLWRIWLKPKVPEPEFKATFRFGFSLVAYPITYLLVLMIIGQLYDVKTAGLLIVGHAVLNLILVKIFGIAGR